MSKPLSEIDLGELDRHWLEQTPLYQKYASKMAKAKLRLAEAKAEHELLEATMKKRIRTNPSRFGLQKATEASVVEALIVNRKYQASLETLRKAKYVVDLLEGILTTLEHRKRTLESLVTLHGQSYFAKPSAKSEDQSAILSDLETSRKKKVRRSLAILSPKRKTP